MRPQSAVSRTSLVSSEEHSRGEDSCSVTVLVLAPCHSFPGDYVLKLLVARTRCTVHVRSLDCSPSIPPIPQDRKLDKIDNEGDDKGADKEGRDDNDVKGDMRNSWDGYCNNKDFNNIDIDESGCSNPPIPILLVPTESKDDEGDSVDTLHKGRGSGDFSSFQDKNLPLNPLHFTPSLSAPVPVPAVLPALTESKLFEQSPVEFINENSNFWREIGNKVDFILTYDSYLLLLWPVLRDRGFLAISHTPNADLRYDYDDPLFHRTVHILYRKRKIKE